MFRRAITAQPGGANNPDGCKGKSGDEINNNISIDSKPAQGTSAAYTASVHGKGEQLLCACATD